MAETMTAAQAPVLRPVQRLEDSAAGNDFEKKHTPWIRTERQTDGRLKVNILVGHEVPHPNVPEHFITSIDVYADDAAVGRFDFEPVVSWPDVSVVLDAPEGTLIGAMEHCNLHGRWWAETEA